VPYFTIFRGGDLRSLCCFPATEPFVRQKLPPASAAKDLRTVAEIINTSWLGISSDHSLGYLLAALIQVVLLLHVLAVGALGFIWLERKVAGRIQDRLGPTRVGGKFGWLQTLADGIKLITKEDITPAEADALLFKLAPYISLTAAFVAYMALPFSDGWVAAPMNIAVFFIIAVLGLEVFGVILAGYASGSKWSLFGGMRESAQVVSYEVPLGLCIVVPVMVCGTMDLVSIGNQQAGLFTNWLIFHDPGMFIVFWVFFTCATASVNRAPFDLAEAESELVAGFHTEYSGLRWSLFFMAEYGSMFTVSALAAIIFFGGWHGPIPLGDMIGGGWGSYDEKEIASNSFRFAGFFWNLLGLLNFMIKTVLFVIVMMWVRWTLPRLRIDQVMTTCLKYCMPIAAMAFLVTMFWTYNDLPSLNDVAPSNRYPHRGDVREGWTLEMAAAQQKALHEKIEAMEEEHKKNAAPNNAAPTPAAPKPAPGHVKIVPHVQQEGI
jgi:NADH-quinone oxidoreductase subunit H